MKWKAWQIVAGIARRLPWLSRWPWLVRILEAGADAGLIPDRTHGPDIGPPGSRGRL